MQLTDAYVLHGSAVNYDILGKTENQLLSQLASVANPSLDNGTSLPKLSLNDSDHRCSSEARIVDVVRGGESNTC